MNLQWPLWTSFLQLLLWAESGNRERIHRRHPAQLQHIGCWQWYYWWTHPSSFVSRVSDTMIYDSIISNSFAAIRNSLSTTLMVSKHTMTLVCFASDWCNAILIWIVYNYAKFATYMSGGCLDQVGYCRTTNLTSLADQSICTEAANMCRDSEYNQASESTLVDSIPTYTLPLLYMRFLASSPALERQADLVKSIEYGD